MRARENRNGFVAYRNTLVKGHAGAQDRERRFIQRQTRHFRKIAIN